MAPLPGSDSNRNKGATGLTVTSPPERRALPRSGLRQNISGPAGKRWRLSPWVPRELAVTPDAPLSPRHSYSLDWRDGVCIWAAPLSTQGRGRGFPRKLPGAGGEHGPSPRNCTWRDSNLPAPPAEARRPRKLPRSERREKARPVPTFSLAVSPPSHLPPRGWGEARGALGGCYACSQVAVPSPAQPSSEACPQPRSARPGPETQVALTAIYSCASLCSPLSLSATGKYTHAFPWRQEKKCPEELGCDLVGQEKSIVRGQTGVRVWPIALKPFPEALRGRKELKIL